MTASSARDSPWGKGQNLGPFAETVNGFCGFAVISSFVFLDDSMTDRQTNQESRMTRQTGLGIRVALIVVASIPLALLAVASQLEPSTAGLGTHQQLGLPPCSFRVLLGIRCPSCGMTTSWSYFVRGQWLASMTVNLGGFMLALAAVATAGLFGKSAWTGRLPGIEAQKWMTFCLLGIAIVTMVDWGRRLAGF
jgi:hypothetical protein